MKDPLRLLAYLLGFTVWLPSLSLFLISHTGVQLPLVVCGVGLLVALIGRKPARLSRRVVYVTTLWSSILFLSSLSSPEISSALRFTLLYLGGFAVMVFGNMIGPLRQRHIVSGYVVGGILSVAYALYQSYAFPRRLPYATLLNNNPSFPSYANSAYLSQFHRTFAFTPEPSVFASLLIPLFLLSLAGLMTDSRRRLFIAGLASSMIGIVVAASLSLFLTLPISVALLLMVSPAIRSRAKKLLAWGALLVVLAVPIALFPLPRAMTVGVSDTVHRVSDIVGVPQNAKTHQSFSVRLAAALESARIFTQHPILGYGVVVGKDYFEAHFPLQALERKTGVDSWALEVLSGQGLLGFFAFLATIGCALYTSRRNPVILAAIVGVLAAIFLQTGYVMLYHVWLWLGAGYSSGKSMAPTSARAIPLHGPESG